MDGILIVDKPAGCTSADVVRLVKRRLRVKVGHLGTLDPFATGVLPLCVGEGTKIAQFLNVADKVYVGCIRLGVATDSGDRTGRVTREAPVPAFTPADLDAIAQQLSGPQMQTPPMYSAIKQSGVPLYKLARAGKEVAREARPIVIHRLLLRRSGDVAIEFEVHCSKGTYVRVLAEDIGSALGTAAHVESLRRTAFGTFTLTEAVSMEDVEAGRVELLIGLRAALRHLREIAINAEGARRARSGQEAALRDLPAAEAGEAATLIGPDGDLVAVVVATPQHRWHFERVFGVASSPATRT
jgi:tRNA pseudouridine55 synthase